jgi:GTP-binding protein
LGEPIAVSAEHGVGLRELYEALVPIASETAAEEEPEEKPLKLALVGRPNVGKSTLFNRLLREERSLTGPEAGITRDAIVVPWFLGERAVLLHDTAGLRKRARSAGEVLERLAVASTLEAIRFADCVILVVDATAPFEKQDLTIADLVAREGRAIVVAANKWDLLHDAAGAVTGLRREWDRLLPQIAGAPLVATSAARGEGLDRLAAAVVKADEVWNRRIPTAELNRFLARALDRHPPPAVRGRRVRVRYMTEAKARPPTFVLFGTQLDALPQSWLRYLQNELRAAFDLPGTPIRFTTRTTRNPYAT